MANKISQFFSFFKNLDNIKLAVGVVYDSIDSVLDVLEFIQNETNDTKLGKTLQNYLPNTIIVLNKIKSVIGKYGKFVGYMPPVKIQGEFKAEFNTVLLQRSAKLDSLLK